MKNLRFYGKSPYRVVAVHGGPGAAGEMEPVARELARTTGVLEPLQTGMTIGAQVEELKEAVEKNANTPVVVMGYSWGAWLSIIFSVRYPALVQKLILISSGPFEQSSAAHVQANRLKRLGEREREELEFLLDALEHPAVRDKQKVFNRIGVLMSKADSFDPEPQEKEKKAWPENQAEIFRNVWREAFEMRKSGELLKAVKQVKCPVTAIHGEYDPHPAEGVRGPISKAIKDFKFVLLSKCGHTPWIEKQAKNAFYEVLKKEILPAGKSKEQQGDLF